MNQAAAGVKPPERLVRGKTCHDGLESTKPEHVLRRAAANTHAQREQPVTAAGGLPGARSAAPPVPLLFPPVSTDRRSVL